MTPKQKQLNDLLEPTVASFGFDLWAVEIIRSGKQSILRLVIDHQERPIMVEDCAQVSRQVSRVLDVEDPLPGFYNLEVSSPGIERSLHTLLHFRRFIGFRIKLKLKAPFEDRKNFTGVIAGIENQSLLLQNGDAMYEFPEEQIDRGHLIVMDVTHLGGSKNGK